MTPASGAGPGEPRARRRAPADTEAGARGPGDRATGDQERPAGAGGDWAGGRDPGSTGQAEDAEAEELGEGTILTDVAALAAERDEYLTALQRLQADFENYRKRVLRQQEEQALRAAIDLVGKVLPVLDTLDLARAHLGGGDDAAGEEARALDQARSQLLDVLAKEGLERVDQAEVAFDPLVHDAVAHAPAGPAAEPTGQARPGAGNGERSNGHNRPPAEPGAPAGTAAQEPAQPARRAATDAGGVPDGSATGPSPEGGVTVDEVLRAGYRWRGQVLRPAMVRVRG